jgi:predicted  nucleic acid-binding Zn-ribbon protein
LTSEALQEQVVKPEAVQYVLERFEDQVTKALENLGGELEQVRRRKETLEREVVNLAKIVAQGDFSPALRAALVDREREIGEITSKLLEARPDSLQGQAPRHRDVRASRNAKPSRDPQLRRVQRSRKTSAAH